LLALQDSDAEVKELFESFVQEMEQHKKTIEARNKNPDNASRNLAARGMPYTLLLPTPEISQSGEPVPGVTMRGVPYSISI
jgi:hypothetical protein